MGKYGSPTWIMSSSDDGRWAYFCHWHSYLFFKRAVQHFIHEKPEIEASCSMSILCLFLATLLPAFAPTTATENSWIIRLWQTRTNVLLIHLPCFGLKVKTHHFVPHLPPSLFLSLFFESSIHHPHNSSVPIVLFLCPLLICFPTITSFFLGLSAPCGPHYRREEMIFLVVGATLMLTQSCVCTHRCHTYFQWHRFVR